MMEYRMSQGSKTLMYFLTVGFSGGGLIFLYIAFQREIWPMLIITALFAGLGYLFFRSASRTLLTIDETSVAVCNGFNTRSVLLDEVAGFRRGDKNALVLELKSGEKPLTIPGALERREEVNEWVQERFPDIAAELAKEVTEEVLHDERYGLTEEDRARRLKQARKIALYGTMVTPFFITWVIISPQPFEILMSILLAIPLAAVVLTWYYKGILRIYMSKTRPYPSLLFVIIFTEVAAFIATLRGYHIYEWNGGLWKLVAALAVVMTLAWGAACRTATAGEKNLFAVYAGMLLLAGLYSYNALLFSNCTYDHNKEVIWRVGIDGKHLTSGKSTSYYLELSPWGRFTDGKSVQVSRSFYHEVKRGDSVNVYLHPGKWGIPWYEVMAD